ncbi:MAG: aquaporin [Gemmatimonadales bacterium]|nr:aquaporin [Gemmatimonadales bacterium]
MIISWNGSAISAPVRRLALGLCVLASALAAAFAAPTVEITAIEVTVADLPRALAFYTDVLQFQVVARAEEAGLATARLRLGEETLILRDFAANGRAIPANLSANDRSFQHIAIVVGDMAAAHAHLLRHRTRIVSTGVQRLPEWNFDAAGIRALYFRDPDGHFLELIQFPDDKGEPRWHRRGGALFRGIDHTALVVSDRTRSVRYYRDVLGLSLAGESFNHGREQERLNRVAGSRVRITTFRAAKGPGIELLHYEAPGVARALSQVVAPNDLSAWRIDLQTSGAATTRETADPDGHRLLVERRPADAPRSEYPVEAVRQHWPRYLMEGAQLGIFMAVALYLALALDHPRSRLHQAIASPLLRRFLFGLGIGITVIILIYSSWGRQSGAHFNPAVTLALLHLARIQPWDALFYILAQFAGGWLGVVLAAAPFRDASAHKAVNYVVTAPGARGVGAAFAAEFLIAFILMAMLRLVHQHDLMKPYVGYVAGCLLVVYITFEAPFSGMSLNPARSVASAIPARNWQAIWIYFAAPILAMLLAVEVVQ